MRFSGMISLLALSLPAAANPLSPETIRHVTELLSSPVPQVTCDRSRYCQSLSEAVCKDEKRASPLLEAAWARFPVPDPRIINGKPVVATEPLISQVRAVENDLFTTLPVTRENINELFSETRSSLSTLIASQAQLPAQVREEMVSSLNSATVMMGGQYLDERIASLGRNNPGVPEEEIRRSAHEEYSSFCGDNGLGVNAFRRGSRLVICPGLIYAIADLGATTWPQIANSLSFTMAHEIGHYASKDSFQEIFREMGNCYNTVSGQENFWELRGEETGADFWGTQILARRMQSQGIVNQDAIRMIEQATVGFCEMAADETYPSGRDRIDVTIGRNPVIRESLGCEAPSSEQPVCSLTGAFPR